MPFAIPDNSTEAAYVSYALLDALRGMLVNKGILSREDIDAVFDAAAAGLSKTPNFASQRGAEFIRQVRLSEK